MGFVCGGEMRRREGLTGLDAAFELDVVAFGSIVVDHGRGDGAAGLLLD